MPTIELYGGNDPVMCDRTAKIDEVWVPHGTIDRDWTNREFALAAMKRAGEFTYGQPVLITVTTAEGEPLEGL